MTAGDLFSDTMQRFVLAQQPNAPDVTELRARRVRQILRHAYERVPLYHNLYQSHGVSIDTINGPDDLWRLPAVQKSHYLRIGPKDYTDGHESLLNFTTQRTSGSIGRALTMYAGAEESSLLLANLWAGWLGLGVTSRDRLLMIAAPYLSERVPPYASLFIPVELTMEEMVEQFRNFRPTVIIGMVEGIALLAKELQRRNVPERHEVRALFPFGQTYSEQLRDMVTSGFDGEVFVLYGSAEGGWIGYECERHNGFHIPEGRIVPQIARTEKPDEPAAPGETGEVIITSLLRGTTPFIRYRLQDAAAIDPTPCPCGRKSPRVVNLEGRVQDFLVATDGHWVGPGTVTIDLVVTRPAIVDHRIVQDERDHVQVSLVLDPDAPPVDPKDVERTLQKHLGPVDVTVEKVDEIPLDPSGKRRRVFRMIDLPDA